jgi:Zn-dependent protease
MGSSIKLGSIFGIKIEIHASWFIIFTLITYFLATNIFPDDLPEESRTVYWTMGVITSLLFFSSVLIHELAHSLIGRMNNIPIHKITLFIFGGAAQMTKEAESASSEFKMAIAGPISSLIMAAIFWGIYNITYGSSEVVSQIAIWLTQINLVLAIFNLLPGFPLDGGRVLRSIVWKISGKYKVATRVATLAGRFLGVVLVGGGIAFIIVYQDIVGGIWLAFIGIFLENSARASYKQMELQQLLKKHTVSQVIRKDCEALPANTLISEFLGEKAPLMTNCYLIKDGGKTTAIIEINKISSVKVGDRNSVTLGELARPLKEYPTAEMDNELLVIAQKMNESDVSVMPVYNGNKLTGLVVLDDIIKYVNNLPGVKL